MKILFWLYRSHTTAKGLVPLMMRVTINGYRINMPTQINLNDKAWDKDKQQVKGSDELSRKYNQFLLTLKSRAWDFYNECIKQDKPVSKDALKNYIQGNDAERHTLLNTMDYHINQLRSRVGRDMVEATVKKYESVRRKLAVFLRSEKGRDDILLDDLSHQFVQEFDVFMRVKQGLKNNGVAKNMQQFKRVIRVALMYEWTTKNPFAQYSCKIVEPKRVFLTAEELKQLQAAVLKCNRLHRVRDVFVFSCYTGLAYADVSKLSAQHFQHINGQDWIILDRTKTKNQSTIPLLPQARAILERYKDSALQNLLPVISSQNLNRYLKELASEAGINKRMTFHAARHTFGTTVTLNEGVDITTVSAMLGHRMLKTTQIYAKVNLQKIAKDVRGLGRSD